MTAPNLKTPTVVTGKTVGYAVTAILSTVVENLSDSGKVFKVNSVYCTNVDGTNTAEISLTHYDGVSEFYIAKTLPVPAGASQILVSRENYIYLEEGHSLRAIASSANDLELVISYEEIS